MKVLPRFVRAPRAGLVSMLVFVVCPTAGSQTVLYTFDGDSAFDQFGISVSGAGT